MSKPEVTTTVTHATGPNNEPLSPPTTVSPTYLGTFTDKADMETLGLTQQLRRNFTLFTSMAFASTAVVAWEMIPTLSVFWLEDGGTPVLFWGLLGGSAGMGCVYASLAEMASMSPTAGGQYHWVSEHAPARFQKGLSYAVAIGWQVFLAGACFMVGSIIQGLIVLNAPAYTYHSYHATLFAIAVIVFSIAFNTVLAGRLPLIEGAVLALHVAGLFAIIITLWVMAPKGDARDVILGFVDNGGWGDRGLSSMIGLASACGLLIGFDCSVHMAEEVRDASRTVPQVILWSAVQNAMMCFVMGISFIFCLGDLDDALNTPTGEPFIQVFHNATKSKAGTTVMTLIIAIMIVAAAISEVATSSRQLWSFARDQGLPFSGWLARVNPTLNVPINAVSVSLLISNLLSLINVGSSTALNAINSLGGISILFSYFVTIGCLVWRRLYGTPLPPRRWSLGRYGLPINVAALVFVTPMLFFYAWPLAQPVTAENMNWCSIVFVGILSIAALYYWIHARHAYTGPVVSVKRG